VLIVVYTSQMPWYVLGRSVRGRPIPALRLGDPHGRLKAAAVACIHGDEPGGIRVVEALQRSVVPAGLDLWLLPDANPDGHAAKTRVNADGVDLNRNFPWKWKHHGKRGNPMFSGPTPLSEPESRAIYALFEGVEPRLVVWYHQPFGVVDDSGGDFALESLYAQLVGMTLTELPRYPGSAASWANHAVPGATSFVVELPPGKVSGRTAQQHALAFLEVAHRMGA
jgi:murein peptide amidase A